MTSISHNLQVVQDFTRLLGALGKRDLWEHATLALSQAQRAATTQLKQLLKLWSFSLPFIPLKPADGIHLHPNGPLAMTVSLHLALHPFITPTVLYN